MKKRIPKTILTLLLLVVSFSTKAVPADPSVVRTIKLDDGSEKQVRLMGDEHGYYWKSIGSRECYRERISNKRCFVEVTESEITKTAMIRRQAHLKMISQNSTSELGFPCTSMNLTGKKRALVILVNFQDKKFSQSNVSQYQDVFNATNYTQGDFHGSVKDYFLAQSGGKMEMEFDVVGPVTVSHNSGYYGAATDTQNDACPQEMVSEAVALVDHQADFSQYDWNGDSEVDLLVVVFAGMDQSSGGEADDIWAHQSSISAQCDHVRLRQYACAPELRNVNGAIQLNSIGTICHEISHCFGLPDTYDQSTGNYGTDKWDIMGTGVHNNNGYTPSGYTAFEKMYCLWQSPVILRDNQMVDRMIPMSEDGDFYLIPNDAWKNEFYLLENRQQTGWDGALPGHGMLITHVDYDEVLFSRNIVNRTGSINGYYNGHERVGLILADNDNSIDLTNYNAWIECYQGDLYPYKNNNSLSNSSTPASTLFHKNIDDSYLLSKPVTDIKENGDGTMSFCFTNNLSTQSINHLSDNEGKIQFVSDTEAKLVVKIKNNGYHDYTRRVGVYVYTKDNGNYVIQQPRCIREINLPANQTNIFEFNLSGLNDDTDYYAFVYYYKDNETNTWTQMGEGYPFNLNERNNFLISIKEEQTVIKIDKHTATVEATIHNESYKNYNRYIALYTYVSDNGTYKIQTPRAFVSDGISPYSDRRLTFTLDELEEGVEYYGFFFYYSDASTNSWTQLDGPLCIVPTASFGLSGDANDDSKISISDAVAIVNHILGNTIENFRYDLANYNGDNKITISDAVAIVNKILGQKEEYNNSPE